MKIKRALEEVAAEAQKDGYKKKIVSPNRCKQFEFNPVDVLNEEKDYKPRETKNKNPEGQVSFL